MPSLAATTSSLDPYPSTEMVRLAEDGAMFKIARFEKTIQARFGPQPCNEASCQFKRVREILPHLRGPSKPATVLLESLNGGTAVVW